MSLNGLKVQACIDERGKQNEQRKDKREQKTGTRKEAKRRRI